MRILIHVENLVKRHLNYLKYCETKAVEQDTCCYFLHFRILLLLNIIDISVQVSKHSPFLCRGHFSRCVSLMQAIYHFHHSFVNLIKHNLPLLLSGQACTSHSLQSPALIQPWLPCKWGWMGLHGVGDWYGRLVEYFCHVWWFNPSWQVATLQTRAHSPYGGIREENEVSKRWENLMGSD